MSGLVALAGLAAFIDVAASGRFHIGENSAPTEAAILLALAFFLTFMHELGHSVVISHYDRKVKSAGFLIYFGSPAFFVEATDSLMLDRGNASFKRPPGRSRSWSSPGWRHW